MFILLPKCPARHRPGRIAPGSRRPDDLRPERNPDPHPGVAGQFGGAVELAGEGGDELEAEARAAATQTIGVLSRSVDQLCRHLDRAMGRPQWSDLGMYLQTVMLLLRAEGLHSCPQVMWTMFREDVRRTVGAPEEWVLLCGLSIGYERSDHQSHERTARARMDETVAFVE